MSSRDELLLLDDDLQARKLEMLRMEYITSKYKLVNCICREAKTVRSQLNRLPRESHDQRTYLEAKANNLDSFCETVKGAALFEQLSDWWVYEFSIGCRGSALYIRHVDSAEIEGEEDNEWLTIYEYDAKYRLLQNECCLLSAEEYAAERNVATATIRVWIRRGKLRSAVKMGNAWKIPELSPPIRRGYSEASYSWETYLDGIPDEYKEVLEPGNLIIRQDRDKQGFTAMVFNSNDILRKEYHLNNVDVEKFELMLIANPAIIYTGDTMYIRQ